MKTTIRTDVVIFLLFSVFLSACAMPSTLSAGETIATPLIALQAGSPQAGSWQTFDIKIDYEYQLAGETMQISGRAGLSQHYLMMYARLKDLRIFVSFLDANAKVLESSLLATNTSEAINEELQFAKELKLPTSTEKISFKYNLDAQQEGG